MGNNEKREWALDDEKLTELDEAVNFLNSRPHLYKNGQIDRYAVGRIMIEWASQKPSTSDEALPIGDVVFSEERAELPCPHAGSERPNKDNSCPI